MLALIALMTSAVSYGVALQGQERGRAGAADEHGGPAGAAALRHPAAAGLRARAGCRAIADWNPFSWAVDGVRALFAGHPSANSVWEACLIVGVLAVLAVVWGARSFAKGLR